MDLWLPRATMPATPDDGAIVLGWLFKVSVLLGAAGLALFDLVSVASSSLTAMDQADSVARVAGRAFAETHNTDQAYATAVAAALDADPANRVPPTSFVVAADGTVTLTLTRRATTIFAGRIGPLRGFAEVSATAVGSPPKA